LNQTFNNDVWFHGVKLQTVYRIMDFIRVKREFVACGGFQDVGLSVARIVLQCDAYRILTG